MTALSGELSSLTLGLIRGELVLEVGPQPGRSVLAQSCRVVLGIGDRESQSSEKAADPEDGWLRLKKLTPRGCVTAAW